MEYARQLSQETEICQQRALVCTAQCRVAQWAVVCTAQRGVAQRAVVCTAQCGVAQRAVVCTAQRGVALRTAYCVFPCILLQKCSFLPMWVAVPGPSMIHNSMLRQCSPSGWEETGGSPGLTG